MAWCILVAGPPASGKTTIARELGDRLGLAVFSKDEIKEILFDEIGFGSREEKVRLGRAAERQMLDAARRTLKAGQSVIIENNFEKAGRDGVERLMEQSGCTPLTVRLGGDMHAIWERYVRREADPGRHRGHVVNDCYPEKEKGKQAAPLAFEEFERGVRGRGMCDFDIGGACIEVDAAQIGNVDIGALAERIRALTGEA